LRGAEAKYAAAAEKFNVEAKQVSGDNVKIAEAAQAIAQESTKRAKLENDMAYQQRKAAEAGGGIPRPASRRPGSTGAVGPALATSAVELERPQRPAKSSAEFLTEWDWAVRLASFGELLLATLTLVFIRNQSARTNAPRVEIYDNVEEFPDSFEVENRLPIKREKFSPKKDIAKTHVSFNSEV